MIAKTERNRAAFRVAAAITTLNVLIAAGFAVAGVVAASAMLPKAAVPTAAPSVFALYAAARALPIAIFALAAVLLGSRPTLLVLGGLAGVVQLLDAGIGFLQGDLGKSVGPLVIALLQFGAVWALARSRSRVSNT